MRARDPRLEGLPAQGELLGGKYRVERTINVGQAAVVVEGTDLSVGQRVAIKILAGEAAQSARRLARFSREGSAGSNIQSEHVVRVFELGTFAGGAFMVMEFLDGEDLSQVLKRGPLPITAAVDYLLQAAEAIAEAHYLGIVHRDLKPANLFIARRTDGSRWVKLLDFGIAKFGDGLTTTASFLGSPLYMAPEQLASSKNADTRADIWALGTLLFEMVTGTTPFPMQSLTEVCTSILYTEPRRLRDLVPQAPAELEAAIVRCLRKNREERFPKVADLATAIARFGGPGASSSLANIVSISNRISPRTLTDFLRTETDDELPTMLYRPPDARGASAAQQSAPDLQSASRTPETGSGFDPGPVAVTSDEPPPRRRSAVAMFFAVLGALVCLGVGGLGAYLTFTPTRTPATPPPPPASQEEIDAGTPPTRASRETVTAPWPPVASAPVASAAPARGPAPPRARLPHAHSPPPATTPSTAPTEFDQRF